MSSPERNPVQKVIAFLGSLRLTVVLLVLSIALVFFGTLDREIRKRWGLL